jgi:prepilin-type processing-associated H-X9-DG protein
LSASTAFTPPIPCSSGYPRTTFDRAKAGKPTWGTPYEGNKQLGAAKDADSFLSKFTKAEAKASVPEVNDVTAALYLALRTQDITSEVFMCPSAHRKKWDFGGRANSALNWTNWQGNAGIREHLSYSYQNPYPSEAAIAAGWKLNTAISPEYAVAADMNPGGDALLKLTAQSPVAQMQEGNSLNHGREGQNVLYGDGHVAFESSPFSGVNQDNIYTSGKTGDKALVVVGPPTGPDDSILLPTANDIGLTEKMLHPSVAKQFDAAEKSAAQEKLVGSYTREDGKGKAKMTIDEKKVAASQGPMTLTFDYAITGQDETGAYVLNLTAPDTKPITATVTITQDGKLSFGDSNYYDGEWKKEK